MNIKINFKKQVFNKSNENLILFIDENFNISSLKKSISKLFLNLINHMLYFPVEPIPSRKSFMQMVMNALTCNASKYQVTPYDIVDDEFTIRLTT